MRRIKKHSEQKLAYFQKYINAYVKVTQVLPKIIYIDAFAGTGKCKTCQIKCKTKGGKKCEICKEGKIVDGSALLSLKTDRPFNEYIFIELDEKNFTKLRQNVDAATDIDINRKNKIKYIGGDANKELLKIAKNTDQYTGNFIFLDPEGSELTWATITALSKIRKIDLLILYPYDMALVRLIKDYPQKLDRFFGTKEWKGIYDSSGTTQKKKDNLLLFYKENLGKLGFLFPEAKQIKQKLYSGHPLYHLIFASRNPTAIKIMSQIFNKELDNQTKMF